MAHPEFVQTAFVQGDEIVEPRANYEGIASLGNEGRGLTEIKKYDGFSDYQAPEVIRPKDLTGWSSTRGLYTGVDVIEHNDYNHEFGQNAHVMADNNHSLVDAVRRLPGDKQTSNMEELTTSWMNDPNAEAVKDRL